jgi:hypothetical protein
MDREKCSVVGHRSRCRAPSSKPFLTGRDASLSLSAGPGGRMAADCEAAYEGGEAVRASCRAFQPLEE